MEKLSALTVALFICACAGDDAAATNPSTSTTGDELTTTGDGSTGETSTGSTTWAENECTKQAAACIGDPGCDACPLCDAFTNDRCMTCDGTPCSCASSLCIIGHLNDEGNDAVFAGCTACLAYCDPENEDDAPAIPECQGILDGTKDD